MADSFLSQFPGEADILDIPPAEWVLSFSRTKPEQKKATGKEGAGARLGYWRVLRHVREQGGSGYYELDVRMQSRLVEATKSDEPPYVPCLLFGNPIPDPAREGQLTIPDSIMFRRRARYPGPTCKCVEGAKLEPHAQEAMTEKAKGTERTVGWKDRLCLGDECPDTVAVKCKLHIVVNVYLPWAVTAGGCAKWRTTGVVNFGRVRSSLLGIAQQTGGWLTGLPMRLVYGEEYVHPFWVPACRFTPAVDGKLLLQAGEEQARLIAGNLQALAQVNRLEAQSRASIVRFVEEPSERVLFGEEFHPGTKATPPVIDGEFEKEVPVGDATVAAPEEAPVDSLGNGEGKGMATPLVPPAVSEVVNADALRRALPSVGITTAEQRAELVAACGFTGIPKEEFKLQQIQALYSQAKSDWEASRDVVNPQ